MRRKLSFTARSRFINELARYINEKTDNPLTENFIRLKALPKDLDEMALIKEIGRWALQVEIKVRHERMTIEGLIFGEVFYGTTENGSKIVSIKISPKMDIIFELTGVLNYLLNDKCYFKNEELEIEIL